ncbi:tetratricopeptide repeat protein [bacterium]|nr:tetratricopeptide repeat protein [bacterium]
MNRFFRMLLATGVLMVATGAIAADNDADARSVDAGGVSQQFIDPSDMSQVPRLTRKVLFRAITKAKRGEHADAIATLEEHLRDHPDHDHFLVRYHLGASHDALGRYEDAKLQYTRSVEMEPRLDSGWFGLGHVEYNLGNYASSGAAFLKAFRTAIDPQPETLYFAAAGYMLAEDHETAAPLLDELCSGKWGVPRHDWYAQLAQCAITLERPGLAEDRLEHYLQIQPDSHEAWFLRYQFEVGFERYREAAVSLTIVGYLRELTPREQRTLGDLYNVVEVPALASDRYRRAMDGDDTSAEDYERLVSAYVAAHDLDEALAALEEGLKTDPTVRLWSLLGDIHYMRQEYAESARAFARVAELDPENGRPLLMIGYCHIEMGNRGLAIQNLVQAAKFDDQKDLAVRLLKRARKLKQA